MLLGLFTGSLGGVFLLGIFTKKANSTGTLIGLVLSGILQYFLKMYTPLNLLMFAFTGAASCVIFGYVFSVLIPGNKRDIDDLTIYSLNEKELYPVPGET